MKTYLKIIIYAFVAILLAVSVTIAVTTEKHNKSLRIQVEDQGRIIDSLLNRRMQVFDVQLYVTDRSRNIIHGRYNKGTITMPQERVYRLELDSNSMVLK